MGLPVGQVGRQRVVRLLLLGRKCQRLRVKRDGRKQVQRFVLPGGRQHAFLAQCVQRRFGDAGGFQLAAGQWAGAQGFHRRELPRAGLGFGGQLPGERVDPFRRALHAAFHPRLAAGGDRRILRAVRDDGLDGLEPGAEGTVF